MAKKKQKQKDILIEEVKSYLHNRTKPDIHIIGGGGIGGNLIYQMFRERYVLQDKIGTIYLYDGDKVEDKNLLRQNFLEKEVGWNKAIALTKRYENYLPIKSVPVYFDPCFKQGDIKTIDAISGNAIIICCVDNIRTRTDIMKELLDITAECGPNDVPLYIDCGNETYHGNVIYCHNSHILQSYYTYLKSRATEKSDAPYHKNCADYAPGDEGFTQIYHVNNFASMYASIYLSKVIAEHPADWWANFDKFSPHGHLFTMDKTTTINCNVDFVLQNNQTQEEAQ
jgi:hypothetical protein